MTQRSLMIRSLGYHRSSLIHPEADAAGRAQRNADLEARALQCSAGDIPASPPPVRLAPQTPPPIASPDLQPEPEALAEGSGGGQLDRTRGTAQLSWASSDCICEL